MGAVLVIPMMTREDVGGAAGKDRSTRPSRKRIRARRLLVLTLILATLGLLGRRYGPTIGREIRFLLAEQATAEGRLDDAEAWLDLLISEAPRQTRPRLLRVQVVRRQGRITEAEEALQRAVELGLPIEEGRRENALLRAGHDFPGAEKSLRRWLGSHPHDEEVRRALVEGQVNPSSN
jgi:predicted Zn-dependent protease